MLKGVESGMLMNFVRVVVSLPKDTKIVEHVPQPSP